MHRELDVTAMARTSRFEIACRACIVAEMAEDWIVETSRHRVQQCIESRRVGDSLDRKSSNLFGAQETETDASDGRGHRL